MTNPWPASRKQADNRDAPSGQVLLVPQARIGRNEDLKALALGRVWQFAVLQR
jgi:hypothetical protein